MAATDRELTLRFLAQPKDVNYGGKAFGGAVMGWIDQAAYALAAGWSGHYAVTVYVGGIQFEAPVPIGSLVEVRARMLYTGSSSMHIGVDVHARDPRSDADTRVRTTHCIVVFVAMDTDGKPIAVPAYVPQSEEEIELQAYAKRVMALRQTIEAERKAFLAGAHIETPFMIDFQEVLEDIAAQVRPLTAQGKVADYIPMLARVPADKFGMAVATLGGGIFRVGDAEEHFSIQSISKVYTLTLALKAIGDALWERVGREPSGSAFNSLVQLESERGIPRNPLINAGAHVVADVLIGQDIDAHAQLLHFARRRANDPSVSDDPEVARSENLSGFRNRALANFLKSFGNLHHEVEAVLDFYFYQCSLTMSCTDLARGFLFLANRGICPWTGEPVLTPSQAKRIGALMLTCGTYDAAGDFAYAVGIPAKSGVGGGIVGIIPNQLAVAVWSPALNAKGNSLAGTAALELFTTQTGMSVF